MDRTGMAAQSELARTELARTSDPFRVPGFTVAITGGTGFVGSALARELIHRGATVRVFDIGDRQRLTQLADHPRLHCTSGDVRDAAAVAELVAGAHLVLHLAAVVGVDRYLADPAAVIDVNVGGTRCVLDACKRHGIPMLLTSTSEVYGALPVDLREDGPVQFGDLHKPRWSYALSKAAAEQLTLAHARDGLPAAVVRYFNVYGPELDQPGHGRVLSKFLGALRAGEALTLVDGGAAVRSFCHVDDAVEATLRVAAGLLGDAPLRGAILNVGRCEPVTIRDLAQRIVALTGHAAGFVDVPGAVAFGPGFEEIPRRVPDLSALRAATGFEARISLDEGLRRTLSEWRLPVVAAPMPASEGFAVPLVQPKVEPDGALLQKLALILTSGRLTNHGPEVQALERELAHFAGGGEVVAVANGFAALVLALQAALIGLPGGAAGRRKAVLPAFTYIATCNAVVDAGLDPVFCDVEPDTWTLDPAALQRVLVDHPDVAVVVPVNVFGVPARLDAIAQVAQAAGAAVVLDDAHALGTDSPPERDGRLHAQVRALSMHATKVLPAAEGGAVVVRDPVLAAEVRRWVNHGLHREPLRSGPGWNFKLSELHAAVARHVLPRVPEHLQRRRTYAAQLREYIHGCGDVFSAQRVPDGVTPSWQNLGLCIGRGGEPELQRVIAAAVALGVEARRYFWPPLHDMAGFAGGSRLPNTDDLCRRQFCLPLHSRMEPEVLQRIERAVDAAAAVLRA
jgi:dTDP-4-amino-4,6-dideoxygalactose transaminase/nucleoside-diphosphate-sugar epimerase